MTEIPNSKPYDSGRYDLEQRTERFAKRCRVFAKKLPRTIANIEDVKQMIRSTGSSAANYIEANESLSKKDFLHRMRICRKEAKESRLWLRLVYVGNNQTLEEERRQLEQESDELLKIFSSIIEKSA